MILNSYDGVVIAQLPQLPTNEIQTEDITFSCSYLYGEKIDLTKADPFIFLNLLTINPEAPISLQGRSPKDWIKEEHIPILLGLIDSEEAASVTMSPRGSNFPIEQISTVGKESMLLIEGFKKGYYPEPAGNSAGFKGDPNEYRKWWVNYMQEKR